jgi:hypothetical protein
MILYRPMDIEELQAVYETGMRKFPQRRPEQPIFYPVLTLDYAVEIAERWNTKTSSASGYVAKFNVNDSYASNFETHQVGDSHHVELWIPAEELSNFNEHILPPILVVSAHFGNNFQEYVPTQFGLQGKNAIAQFVALAHTLNYSLMDFRCELGANHTAVFLNYSFWVRGTFGSHGITSAEQERVLSVIRTIWRDMFPEIYLPLTDSPLVEC